VAGIAGRLKALFASQSARQNVRARICGNGVRIRLVERPSKRAPALIGFVHNRDSDSQQLLHLAAAWVNSRTTT